MVNFAKIDIKRDEDAEARQNKIQKMLQGLPSMSKEKVERYRMNIASGYSKKRDS